MKYPEKLDLIYIILKGRIKKQDDSVILESSKLKKILVNTYKNLRAYLLYVLSHVGRSYPISKNMFNIYS